MKQNIYDNPTFFEEYRKLRDSGVNYNNFVEQPAFKETLPNLKNKKILDLGCGMGEFTRYCVTKGAIEVVGVDISKNMIDVARQHSSYAEISYINRSIEELELPIGYFDVVVSSLALHYIKDYRDAIKKINNCLKKGGTFIFSTEHPIVTARKKMDGWITDENGDTLYFPVDNYQEEGERTQFWYIDGVVKYHRTFSTLINQLIINGFQLEQLVEPVPIKAGLDAMPKIKNELRKPSFLIVKSTKLEGRDN
ncbi:class I SAM-dependent methyltransferase [Ectobacillus funiculus]|uniref:class I SAM-dependent methyltransferase n=1 Tax=Ectobacillus funiculus TaxID=137993 RepID=UPI00397C18DF